MFFTFGFQGAVAPRATARPALLLLLFRSAPILFSQSGTPTWALGRCLCAARARPGGPPRPGSSRASHGRLVAEFLAPGDAGNVARASVQNVAKTLSGGVRR